MKLINIESSILPDIDSSVKECVNLGQWLLFKPAKKLVKHDDVSFYLKVEHSCYFGLNDLGGIVCQLDNVTQDLVMDEVFYFSDLPKPLSLSNIFSVSK